VHVSGIGAHDEWLGSDLFGELGDQFVAREIGESVVDGHEHREKDEESRAHEDIGEDHKLLRWLRDCEFRSETGFHVGLGEIEG
jgi:hypothetical protein